MTLSTDRVMWAVVVVREGMIANALNSGLSNDLYNPTRDVICKGILTTQGISSSDTQKFNRKLMIGDKVQLLIALMGGQPTVVNSTYCAEYVLY